MNRETKTASSKPNSSDVYTQALLQVNKVRPIKISTVDPRVKAILGNGSGSIEYSGDTEHTSSNVTGDGKHSAGETYSSTSSDESTATLDQEIRYEWPEGNRPDIMNEPVTGIMVNGVFVIPLENSTNLPTSKRIIENDELFDEESPAPAILGPCVAETVLNAISNTYRWIILPMIGICSRVRCMFS